MKKLILFAAAAFLLGSCATLKVTTDYDHSKDFSTFKTYSIYSGNNQSISQLNQERIINSLKSALSAKGYTEVATNPDMLVNVNTIVKNKQSVSANTDTNFYGYGGFYRPYGYWGGAGMGYANSTTTFNVDEYKDGSVIVDIVDPKTNKMFWEGVGNSEIDGNFNNPDQKIAAAMQQILQSFPSAGTQPKK